MKRSLSIGLSTLVFSLAIATTAAAETRIDNQLGMRQPHASMMTSETTPFSLVGLAYQGYLKAQGIPSYASLITAYKAGTLSAKDLVRAGIAARQLPESAATDRAYLHAVEVELLGFGTN